MPSLTPRVTKFQDTLNGLRKLFASGDYAPGDMLPTVRQLAGMMDVSVYTLHSALAELRREGIIDQEPGRKMFHLKRRPEPVCVKETPWEGRVHISVCVPPYTNLRKLPAAMIRRNFRNWYESVHPDVEIEEIRTDPSRSRAEEQQLGMLLEGDRPTGGYLSCCSLGIYREMNLLRPLEPDDCAFAEYPGDIRRLIGYDGDIYIQPQGFTMSYVLYNKAHFRAAELDPDEVFSSSAHFGSALRQLRAKTPDRMPCTVYDDLQLMQLMAFQMALHQQSLKVHERAETPAWCDTEQLERNISWIFDLLIREKLLEMRPYNFTPAGALDLMHERTSLTLDEGQIASLLLYAGRADEFGVAPLPGGMGMLRTPGNIGGTFINAAASEPAARAFLAYLSAFRAHCRELSPAERIRGSFLEAPYARMFSEPMPEDWRNSFAFLRQGLFWEPERSNWNKRLLSDAVDFIRRDASEPDGHSCCRLLGDFCRFELEASD